MYIIYHLNNTSSTRHQAQHQHNIRHIMYIRYSFINALSLILLINALSLHRKVFRWRASQENIDFLFGFLLESLSLISRTMSQVYGDNFSIRSHNVKNKLPGFVAVTGIACSGLPEEWVRLRGPFIVQSRQLFTNIINYEKRSNI